ncbi:hypothetical protein [Streptomyces antnestii]|uniref:hypothetical protein n=1 Tax=Streptomyces antnestii TaxID=2494256 RepID=UPI0016761516|nr:hypothetical protein [Streptomyces sp. San01]
MVCTASRPAGAATALTELAEDQTRVLGADDPNTLETRKSAANWRDAAENRL